MKLFVLGLSHKTAPLELREKFHVSEKKYEHFNRLITHNGNMHEQAILSTCNRTEIYGVAQAADDAYAQIVKRLSEYASVPEHQLEKSIYFKQEADSVRHLFKVAAGLDSMVVGETEILGQVKAAYTQAHNAQYTGGILNRLFQKSLHIGKKVRSETTIGKGRVSVASVALDLAKKIYLDLSSKSILIIGSGEVAGGVCEAMASRGARQFFVANRTLAHADELVQRFSGATVLYEHIDTHMREVDILIASTSSDETLIDLDRVRKWMKLKRGKDLFIIDLGIPRNVDSRVSVEEGVYLYNIDDLKSVADQGLEQRRKVAKQCQQMILESAQYFMQRYQNFHPPLTT